MLRAVQTWSGALESNTIMRFIAIVKFTYKRHVMINRQGLHTKISEIDIFFFSIDVLLLSNVRPTRIYPISKFV